MVNLDFLAAVDDPDRRADLVHLLMRIHSVVDEERPPDGFRASWPEEPTDRSRPWVPGTAEHLAALVEASVLRREDLPSGKAVYHVEGEPEALLEALEPYVGDFDEDDPMRDLGL